MQEHQQCVRCTRYFGMTRFVSPTCTSTSRMAYLPPSWRMTPLPHVNHQPCVGLLCLNYCLSQRSRTFRVGQFCSVRRPSTHGSAVQSNLPRFCWSPASCCSSPNRRNGVYQRLNCTLDLPATNASNFKGAHATRGKTLIGLLDTAVFGLKISTRSPLCS